MFVIVGATGKTGSAAMHALLAAGACARAVVRRPEQAAVWRERGAEVAVADVADANALAAAFSGAAAVYLMNPPEYGSADLFARAQKVHTALLAAATRARVSRIVALSSVGAQHTSGTGNILTTHDLEQRLAAYAGPVTILRAANFMENWGWVMEPVLAHGVLPSMFLPIERRLPMQSAVDVGAAAAALMQEGGPSRRLVELHGPQDYSPVDVAAALQVLLGRPVKAMAVPESEWPGVFRAQGFPERSVQGFCEMYQGFNRGLNAFEGSHETRRGPTRLEPVLASLLESIKRPTEKTR